jgi:hypothetical protein
LFPPTPKCVEEEWLSHDWHGWLAILRRLKGKGHDLRIWVSNYEHWKSRYPFGIGAQQELIKSCVSNKGINLKDVWIGRSGNTDQGECMQLTADNTLHICREGNKGDFSGEGEMEANGYIRVLGYINKKKFPWENARLREEERRRMWAEMDVDSEDGEGEERTGVVGLASASGTAACAVVEVVPTTKNDRIDEEVGGAKDVMANERLSPARVQRSSNSYE